MTRLEEAAEIAAGILFLVALALTIIWMLAQ